MKSIKTVAVGACALVALSAGISSATAAAPAKSDVQTRTGSCASGTPGEAAIANGVANLTVPEQMSWAQVRTFPQGLKLSTLKTLKFDSKADTPGVVWAKITTDHGEVVYSPNTQTGGETGLGADMATHNVLAGTVRYNDDAGFDADVSWKELLAQAGTDKVATVSVTAGCANPVGIDGAHVQVDNLTLNSKVIDFKN
jgi:hypothetical protein